MLNAFQFCLNFACIVEKIWETGPGRFGISCIPLNNSRLRPRKVLLVYMYRKEKFCVVVDLIR